MTRDVTSAGRRWPWPFNDLRLYHYSTSWFTTMVERSAARGGL